MIKWTWLVARLECWFVCGHHWVPALFNHYGPERDTNDLPTRSVTYSASYCLNCHKIKARS